MSITVFALTNSDREANAILQSLIDGGFTPADISIISRDESVNQDFANKHMTKDPERAVVSGAIGGMVGGALGLIAGMVALMIPGFGPLITAGTIVAGLGGAAAGMTVGGLTGWMIGMGISEPETTHYEGEVREGRIVISVHADNDNMASRATQVFTDHDMESTRSSFVKRVVPTPAFPIH